MNIKKLKRINLPTFKYKQLFAFKILFELETSAFILFSILLINNYNNFDISTIILSANNKNLLNVKNIYHSEY